MKTLPIICTLLLLGIMAPAQNIKPCDSWITDFIQCVPKISDGVCINNYIVNKLMNDTSLNGMATCMIGLRIYTNCKGEFSYEKQDYRNNSLLASQCEQLLKKTEAILDGINHFSPGTIGHQAKDFTFKLVVKVKSNGKPIAEILF